MKRIFLALLLISSLASAQNNNFIWIKQATHTASGTNTYTASIGGFTLGTDNELKVKFTNGNTGASTLAINGGAAQTLRKNGSSALSSGDLLPGATYRLTYDGTYWQVFGIGGSGGGSTAWADITGKPTFFPADTTLFWKTRDTTFLTADVLIKGDYLVNWDSVGPFHYSSYEPGNPSNFYKNNRGYSGNGQEVSDANGYSTYSYNTTGINSYVTNAFNGNETNYNFGSQPSSTSLSGYTGHKFIERTLLGNNLVAEDMYKQWVKRKFVSGITYKDYGVFFGYNNFYGTEEFAINYFTDNTTNDFWAGKSAISTNHMFKVTFPDGQMFIRPQNITGPAPSNSRILLRTITSGPAYPAADVALGTGLSISGDALNVINGTPTGGTINQVLTKNSGTNYDYSWQDPSGGGATNLAFTPSPTNGIVTSDTGTDATIPLGNGTNSGLSLNDYTTSEKSKLAGISGTNTGDQTSIVGITGTKAQFNTAVTDGDIQYVGDAPTAHTLDSHSNVTITSNTSGEILKWNGSAWINNTLAEAGIQPAGSYLTSEVDGSTTNELQTISHSSDATSHTVTLSNSGGSIQLIEGANITLTTGGSGSAGTVTIASTGGGGGDFVGPASSVDGEAVVFDGTTGKLGKRPTGTAKFPILGLSTTTFGANEVLYSNGVGNTAASSSAFTWNGTTLNATQFNGVPLTTAGSSTQYLSADGTYSTPAGGGGSGLTYAQVKALKFK